MSTSNANKEQLQHERINQEIDETFKTGFKAHQNNDFLTARKHYQKVLELHPAHIKTLYLLGALCCQTNEFAQGVEYLDKTILLAPEHAEAYSSRGNALNQLQRFDEALLCYNKATKINPKYADAYHNQGITLVNLERPKEAIASFEEAIRLNPNYAMAYFEKGNVELRLKQYQKAIDSFKQTVTLLPMFEEASAYLEFSKNAFAQSQKTDIDGIQEQPIDADLTKQTLNSLLDSGLILEKLNLKKLALDHFEEATKRFPDSVKAQTRLGILHKDEKRYAEALACLNTAIKLNPNNALALRNRGEVYTRINQPQNARADFESCLTLDRDSHDYYYYHVAFANRELGLYDIALENYRLWIRLGGSKRNELDHASADFAESLIWLLKGCYTLGWQLYETRWIATSKEYFRNFKQLLWLGDFDISDKHILIHAEQGLGDVLNFFRYLDLVASTAAKVTLEVHAPLQRLLKHNTNITVIANGTPLPDFDVQCPMMSLPLAFKTTVDTIPTIKNLIHADTATNSAWAKKINHLTANKPKALKIGFVAAGNPRHVGDTARSIPLQKMLAHLPNQYHLFCLQKEFREGDKVLIDARQDIVNFSEELIDFMDTAGLIAQLDLVITIDSSVAHLAASMGKPTWILLPFSPDFRWLLDRNDSPWYSSVKLYRQTILGDWDEVFARVKSDLRQFKPN